MKLSRIAALSATHFWTNVWVSEDFAYFKKMGYSPSPYCIDTLLQTLASRYAADHKQLTRSECANVLSEALRIGGELLVQGVGHLADEVVAEMGNAKLTVTPQQRAALVKDVTAATALPFASFAAIADLDPFLSLITREQRHTFAQRQAQYATTSTAGGSIVAPSSQRGASSQRSASQLTSAQPNSKQSESSSSPVLGAAPSPDVVDADLDIADSNADIQADMNKCMLLSRC